MVGLISICGNIEYWFDPWNGMRGQYEGTARLVRCQNTTLDTTLDRLIVINTISSVITLFFWINGGWIKWTSKKQMLASQMNRMFLAVSRYCGRAVYNFISTKLNRLTITCYLGRNKTPSPPGVQAFEFVSIQAFSALFNVQFIWLVALIECWFTGFEKGIVLLWINVLLFVRVIKMISISTQCRGRWIRCVGWKHNTIYIYEEVAAPWLLRSRNYIGPLTEAEIEIYIKKKQEFKLFVNGF